MYGKARHQHRFGGARYLILLLVGLLGAMSAVPAMAAEDSTAPSAPIGFGVAQGASWQANNDFDITWETPPNQQSPIAAVHYELCPAAPVGPCTTGRIAGIGIEAASITVPHIGWFWIRIWLEDGSGNVDPEATSNTGMLRFDDEAPPPGQMEPRKEWLDATTPTSPTLELALGPDAVPPLSGIGGYSVAVDGSEPDGTVDAAADQDNETWRADYTIDHLPQGVTEFRIRGISNSGVASLTSRVEVLRLDRQPPSISIDGLAQDEGWRRSPVQVSLTGHDQTGLSGMGAAPLSEPVENGAYVAVALDGGPQENARGPQAEKSIASDGHHRLTAVAFDRAGNASVEYVWNVRVDQTPPTGAFETQHASDPRQLNVSVNDALSGVATGEIEYRKAGEGEFRSLPTTLSGGRLGARLDDVVLPAGRYEFRAVVRDVAGNRAVVDARRDGSTMALDLPVRASSKLQVAATSTKKRCVVVKRKRKGEFRRVKRCRTVRAGATVAYGTRLQSTGRLTHANGAPIGNATVTVAGQPRAGGPFAPVGTAKTDARGAFEFAVPAGPSRTLRYRYAGNDTDLPATADVVTRVTAAARLAVDRRRVRNGQAVRFSGRLLGKPIPKAGKLVTLQAKVGRGWRTFATPRANAKGVFRHRYRFTATTGLRRYAFRAVVTREAAYSYERGSSKLVHVTVRGRR